MCHFSLGFLREPYVEKYLALGCHLPLGFVREPYVDNLHELKKKKEQSQSILRTQSSPSHHQQQLKEEQWLFIHMVTVTVSALMG